MNTIELLSQVYKTLELALQRDIREVRSDASSELLKISLPPAKKFKIIAIDAGLGRVQVALAVFDVVQVVAIGGRAYVNKFFVRRSKYDVDVSELINYVRICELKTALSIQDISDSVIVLDGMLERAQDPKLMSYISSLIERSCILIAVSKQYLPRIKLANKKREIIAQVLKREVYGKVKKLKVKLHSGPIEDMILEVYFGREVCIDSIRDAIAHICTLCINSISPGYPLPLHIADALSRLSIRELESIRSIIERLGISSTEELTLPLRPVRII